jgi:hypothetical protein
MASKSRCRRWFAHEKRLRKDKASELTFMLGILNLSVQNNALLLKHLHKFYNHDSTPWVQLIWDSYYYGAVPHAVTLAGSFWWKSIIKLSDQYRLLTKCAVGNGSSILFWSDLWGD